MQKRSNVDSRKATGFLGEEIASEFLRRKGYNVVKRNYMRPWGEIDIIAEKDEEVRFIEVKTVSREPSADISREIDYRPEELVSPAKLKKVSRTAALYMEENQDEREYQIDVVGVILSDKTKTARCRLFEQVL